MSAFGEYESYDGLGLAALVAAGEVTAEELLAAAIERAERLNPLINALSQKLYDRAHRTLAQGLPEGPFRGVPFLLKDGSVALAGTVTTHGSRLFADQVADHSSTLVERYEGAGVVIFGKTTTPEMGLAASTETTLTGNTVNPWDSTRTSGGSSGGAAAAVAAGIVPIAHGSDGGGSIRIPASACGLFGLKPTRGRTPAGPRVAEVWGGLGVSHVLSRSVRDSAAMLDATQGPDSGDPYSAPPAEWPFLAEVGTDPGTLRVALQLEPLSGVPVDPECVGAARDAAALMESLGHRVEEARPQGDWEELSHALWVLVATSVGVALRRRARALGRALVPEDMERVTWSALEFARTLPVEDYPEALATVHRWGRHMAEFHRRYDVIMSPTLARPPVPLGPQHMNNPDIEGYRRALAEFSPFTSPFNMSGQPSMSVPLHWSADGLPVGVMFSARFGDEATLLRLAGRLEAARPWSGRRPPLAFPGPAHPREP